MNFVLLTESLFTLWNKAFQTFELATNDCSTGGSFNPCLSDKKSCSLAKVVFNKIYSPIFSNTIISVQAAKVLLQYGGFEISNGFFFFSCLPLAWSIFLRHKIWVLLCTLWLYNRHYEVHYYHPKSSNFSKVYPCPTSQKFRCWISDKKLFHQIQFPFLPLV